MKKRIIIIVVCLLAALALTAVLIPKEVYTKWFGKNNLDENSSAYNILVYVKNDKNKIVGVNVPVNSLEEDQIRQKWDILTTNSEMIPEGYASLLTKDIVLNDYSIEERTLKLELTEQISETTRETLESLVWTYVDENIDNLEIYVNGEMINEVSDYTFYELNKKMGINYQYETMYLYESTATTIVYQEDNYIMPVTYFHLNEDVCDYIVMKILDNIDSSTYDYTLEDSVLTLDFVDASVLTTNQIASISETVALNFDLNSLNINNNENVFYQRVFKEMTENE